LLNDVVEDEFELTMEGDPEFKRVTLKPAELALAFNMRSLLQDALEKGPTTYSEFVHQENFC